MKRTVVAMLMMLYLLAPMSLADEQHNGENYVYEGGALYYRAPVLYDYDTAYRLYRLPDGADEPELLLEGTGDYYRLIVMDNWVYYTANPPEGTGWDSSRIRRVRTDGTGDTALSATMSVSAMFGLDGLIYVYDSERDGGMLMCYQPDPWQLLHEINVSGMSDRFSAQDGWLYMADNWTYPGASKTRQFWRVRADGGVPELVLDTHMEDERYFWTVADGRLLYTLVDIYEGLTKVISMNIDGTDEVTTLLEQPVIVREIVDGWAYAIRLEWDEEVQFYAEVFGDTANIRINLETNEIQSLGEYEPYYLHIMGEWAVYDARMDIEEVGPLVMLRLDDPKITRPLPGFPEQ